MNGYATFQYYDKRDTQSPPAILDGFAALPELIVVLLLFAVHV